MILTATCVLLAVLPLFFYFFIPFLKDLPNKHHNQKKIVIIVIGPLIRSPRMLNHIKSFLVAGFDVEVVGNATENDMEQLRNKFHQYSSDEDDNLKYNILLAKDPIFKGKVGLVCKALGQLKDLVFILWKLRSSDYLLMQNPPSIPLLPLAIVSKLLFDWRIIIDWHNFGYSILALKLQSEKSIFVRLYRFIELSFGKYADYHLTVTHKMKAVLVKTWNLEENSFKSGRISVLHDKPDSQFYPVDSTKKKDVLESIDEISEKTDLCNYIEEYTVGITSTSFTPDEDLTMLLNSLEKLQAKLHVTGKKFLLIITGKGPLKAHFVEKFHEKKFANIAVKFFYLKIENYPSMLQISDFGISLHYSSSGVDLPMKVLDMFGCGLPCLSYYYKTVEEELIDVGVTGDVFQNEDELCNKVYEMIDDSGKRLAMREHVIMQLHSGDRWHQSWLSAFENDLRIVRS